MADVRYVRFDSYSGTHLGTIDDPFTYDEWLSHMKFGPNGLGIEENTIYYLSGTKNVLNDVFYINARDGTNINVSATNWNNTPWYMHSTGDVIFNLGTSGISPNLILTGGRIRSQGTAANIEFNVTDNALNKNINIDNVLISNDNPPS